MRGCLKSIVLFTLPPFLPPSLIDKGGKHSKNRCKSGHCPLLHLFFDLSPLTRLYRLETWVTGVRGHGLHTNSLTIILSEVDLGNLLLAKEDLINALTLPRAYSYWIVAESLPYSEAVVMEVDSAILVNFTDNVATVVQNG